MSKRRTRADWIKLFKEFEVSGISLSAFCTKKKIAYQSAKNWSSRLKKEDEYPTASTGTANTSTGTRGTEAINEKGNKGKGTTSKAKNSNSSKKRSNKASKASDSTGEGKERVWKPHWDNLIPIKPGEQKALKHGAYAKALPPDITAEMDTYGRDDLRNLEEELKLTKGRLILVSQKRAQWDARTEYNQSQEPYFNLDEIKEESSAEGTKRTTVKKRPDFEHQEERLTRRIAWLVQVQEQLMKRPNLTADEAIELRAKILRDGKDKGASWSEIGLEIEMRGLELPFTLQALIRKELEQPQEEDDLGLTDDDLEKLAEEYEKELALEADFHEVRSQEVDDIYSTQEAERTST